eukprot:476646-Amphidinium_carterae.1
MLKGDLSYIQLGQVLINMELLCTFILLEKCQLHRNHGTQIGMMLMKSIIMRSWKPQRMNDS